MNKINTHIMIITLSAMALDAPCEKHHITPEHASSIVDKQPQYEHFIECLRDFYFFRDYCFHDETEISDEFKGLFKELIKASVNLRSFPLPLLMAHHLPEVDFNKILELAHDNGLSTLHALIAYQILSKPDQHNTFSIHLLHGDKDAAVQHLHSLYRKQIDSEILRIFDLRIIEGCEWSEGLLRNFFAMLPLEMVFENLARYIRETSLENVSPVVDIMLDRYLKNMREGTPKEIPELIKILEDLRFHGKDTLIDNLKSVAKKSVLKSLKGAVDVLEYGKKGFKFAQIPQNLTLADCVKGQTYLIVPLSKYSGTNHVELQEELAKNPLKAECAQFIKDIVSKFTDEDQHTLKRGSSLLEELKPNRVVQGAYGKVQELLGLADSLGVSIMQILMNITYHFDQVEFNNLYLTEHDLRNFFSAKIADYSEPLFETLLAIAPYIDQELSDKIVEKIYSDKASSSVINRAEKRFQEERAQGKESNPRTISFIDHLKQQIRR